MTTDTITVARPDGTRIEVDRCGSGEPSLVLLHGMGHTADQVRPLAERLAARRQVITYDARGSRRNGPAPRTPPRFSIHEMVDDLIDVVRWAVDGPMALAGVSMGGAVAEQAVHRHQLDVRGLVLIGPGVGVAGVTVETRGYVSWMAEVLEADGFDGLRDVHPDPSEVDGWRQYFDARALVALWRGFPASVADGTERAAGLPVTAVAWPDDPMHPLGLAHERADEVIEVPAPGAGPLDPDVFAPPIETVLAKVG